VIIIVIGDMITQAKQVATMHSMRKHDPPALLSLVVAQARYELRPREVQFVEQLLQGKERRTR
jgi:hypothetical protein